MMAGQMSGNPRPDASASPQRQQVLGIAMNDMITGGEPDRWAPPGDGRERRQKSRAGPVTGPAPFSRSPGCERAAPIAGALSFFAPVAGCLPHPDSGRPGMHGPLR